MAPKLPTTCSLLLKRPTVISSSTSQSIQQQTRNATFVPRHRRPYQFTQLVQLSDGSTFTVRTTSPAALYKSAKDSRNHVLWQPSDKSLRNVEVDEAGKLAAFRERFGRGWDMSEGSTTSTTSPAASEDAAAAAAAVQAKKPAETAPAAPAPAPAPAPAEAAQEPAAEDPFDSLVDLISGYATADDKNTKGGLSAKDQARKDKAKKK
ncbi:hypothetical protein QBC43DRAFT_382072 [Cladorrhinum sp. PSN259]|nr:hypothetical protein QBC43DRAFT_382072 [Cladorrhinum sp. PSN259]